MKSIFLFLIFTLLSLCHARTNPSPTPAIQPSFKTSAPTSINLSSEPTSIFVSDIPTFGPSVLVTVEPSTFDDQNSTDTNSGASPVTIAEFPFYVNLLIILAGLASCISLGFILSYIQSRRQAHREKYDFGTVHKNLLADGKDVARYK